jgi:hypothetical protein
VLGGYPVWRVKTGSSGSGSCNMDASWHQLVGTGTRMDHGKNVLPDLKLESTHKKKKNWKQGKDIYKCKKFDFFQNLISRLKFIINY